MATSSDQSSDKANQGNVGATIYGDKNTRSNKIIYRHQGRIFSGPTTKQDPKVIALKLLGAARIYWLTTSQTSVDNGRWYVAEKDGLGKGGEWVLTAGGMAVQKDYGLCSRLQWHRERVQFRRSSLYKYPTDIGWLLHHQARNVV